MINEVTATNHTAEKMPVNSHLRVFLVDSSDGKQKYYVQIMSFRDEHSKTRVVTACTCMSGFNAGPLSVAGVQVSVCKHSDQVVEFLTKEKK